MKRNSKTFYDDDDDSTSISPLDYDDLLVQSKTFHISISDLIEKHFDKYSSQAIKNCKCNTYSSFIHAGPFVLGTQLNDAQFVDLDTYIARRIGDFASNRYYLLKVVTLPSKKEDETYSQRQAKLLLYNEFSVLSLLSDQEGVIHHQGLYVDFFYENASENSSLQDESESDNSSHISGSMNPFELTQNCETNSVNKQNNNNHLNKLSISQHSSDQLANSSTVLGKGRLMRRVILALECFIPHIYCSTVYPLAKLFSRFTTVNSEYENLQEYVKRFKNIPEMRALLIFKQIVNVIFELHQKNIAHRDLRLENVLFSHRNEKIILVNFGLARYVINDLTCICDHRGSSAYISPDVLKRKPYNPKASDCWALGIIFYTMLFGKFPFYADSFNELFKKINSGQFTIPSNVLVWKNSHEHQPLKTETHSIVVFDGTIQLIHSLIVTEANKRMNIIDLKDRLSKLIEAKFNAKTKYDNNRLVKTGKCFNDDLQVVPDIDMPELRDSLRKNNVDGLDEQLKSFLSQFRITIEPVEGIRQLDFPQTSLIDSNFFKTSASLLITTICDFFKRNPIKKEDLAKINNIEHLHDHNYFQKDQDLGKSDDCNEFQAYLEKYDHTKIQFESPPQLMPSTYSILQNRFYLMCGPSNYSSNFKNNNSLLLEEFEKASKHEVHTKRLRTRSSMCIDSSFNTTTQRQPYKGFVRLGSKMAKSNFSVLKIDSDIRPLNENELNLVKNYTYHANSQ